MAQEVKDSKQLLNSFVNTVPDIIYRLNTEGIITFINDTVTKYGYSTEELIGTSILELVHPEDRKKAAYRINERRTGDRSTKNLKARLLTKKNTAAPVEAVSRDVQNEPIFLITAEGLYDSQKPETKSFKGTKGIARSIPEKGQVAEQIEQQTELLRLVLDILPHPLFVLDAYDYTINIANSAAHLGHLPKEATCYALLHKSDRPCGLAGHPCPLEKIRETKRPATVEHIHYGKSGIPSIIEIHSHPIFDSEGNVSQLVEYCLDITNRKQVEQAVQDSHEYTENIVETVREPLVVLNPGLRVISANHSFYQKFKVTNEETIGQYIYDLGNRQWDIPKLRELLEEILPENTSFDDFEVEHDFLSIGRRLMLLNARRIYRKANNTQLILLAIEDVTERVQAERALQESIKKYRHITETITDYIYSVRVQDGRPSETSHGPGCVSVTGYTPEEFEDNPHLWTEMVHVEDRKVVKEHAKRILSGQDVRPLEHRIVRKDGVMRWVRNTPIPLFDNQQRLLPYDGVIQDITERKELEAQLEYAQRMEAIGTLAGGIAHNFNNLLMAIQGNTSLMFLNIDSSHPHYERLKTIEQSVQRGAELTKQLLGFARGGKYVVKPTDLNALIKRQNRMFGHTKKEITVRGKYEKNLWTVEVDEGQIEQVMLNLYVNAADAMSGGGELYVQTENVILDESHVKRFAINMKPGKYIRISVTDTGIGMEETTQQRIFEPFFTTKKMDRGTGLGLASAYGVIENHGGVINVYSIKGEGTTFNLYLPALEKEVIEEKKLVKGILKGSETVLLVDDEDMIIDVDKQLLKELGYTALIARSGKEAIEIFRKNRDKISMVILDMIMHGMSGSETYDRLKKVNSDIKVLLSSGYSIDGLATEILDRGCDGFIQKPFKMKELSQKIREILDKK